MTRLETAAFHRRSMAKRIRRATRLGIAIGLGAAATHAAAVTCTASTPGVAFGTYDVYAAGVTNGNGTLTVICNYDASDTGVINLTYAISLAAGSSNSFVQRQMKSGANTFGYNLYTTNAYAVVWGDGTGSTATISGTMRLNNGHPSQTNTHTVYGRIPALQDVAVANDYRDNVTATVTY